MNLFLCSYIPTDYIAPLRVRQRIFIVQISLITYTLAFAQVFVHATAYVSTKELPLRFIASWIARNSICVILLGQPRDRGILVLNMEISYKYRPKIQDKYTPVAPFSSRD